MTHYESKSDPSKSLGVITPTVYASIAGASVPGSGEDTGYEHIEGVPLPEVAKELRILPPSFKMAGKASATVDRHTDIYPQCVTTQWGARNKYSRSRHYVIKESCEDVKSSFEIHCYGEDTTLSAEYTVEGSTDTLNIVGVFDGHGDNPHYSGRVAQEYSSALLSTAKTIINMAIENHDELRKILTEVTALVERASSETCRAGGGSTVCLVGVVKSGSERVVFNISLGDSSAYMRRGDLIQQINIDHSVDNLEAYRAYVADCKSAGRVPSKAVYSRWNCNPESTGFLSRDGKLEMINMYKYDDKTGIVHIDPENAEHVQKTIAIPYRCIGGIQSIRKFLMKMPDGSIRTLPGHEHQNWGSTLQGNCQFLKSHGDLFSKATYGVGETPDITIYIPEPHEDVHIAVGSDGVWDRLWTLDVFEDASTDAEAWRRSVTEKLSTPLDGLYSVTKEYDEPKASWDDVSFCLLISEGSKLCPKEGEVDLPSIHKVPLRRSTSVDAILCNSPPTLRRFQSG